MTKTKYYFLISKPIMPDKLIHIKPIFKKRKFIYISLGINL